jgi:hypothetical protein
MPDYSSEEIRRWKSLIYGPNIGSGNKVEGWASGAGSSTSTSSPSPRRRSSSSSSKLKTTTTTKKNSPNSSFNSSFSQDEWMGESPCGKKRSYRTKGNNSAAAASIGRPSLY